MKDFAYPKKYFLIIYYGAYELHCMVKVVYMNMLLPATSPIEQQQFHVMFQSVIRILRAFSVH